MTSNTEWWTTFFSGRMLEPLRRMDADFQQAKLEADFIARSLDLGPGARVLDAPCGAGRHSLELAARGFRPAGIDIAPELVSEARARAGERRLEALFEVGDMRHLPWEGVFDGAFSFGNSFPYFDDAGNAAFLASLHRALRPGGRLVIETGYAAESLLPALERRAFYELGDLIFLAARRYDAASGRLEVEYTVIVNGGMERKRASIRLYTYRELRGLIEAAGFSGVEGTSSFEGAPYELGCGLLYLSATKEGT
jgi:SAM-dependent methyltransferase